MTIEEMELYIKQLEDENLRLKNSNKSLRTNNKSLLEGNKKLQSQIGKFKSKRICELKNKIDEYYEILQKRKETSYTKYVDGQLTALEIINGFIKEIGI